MIRAGKIDCALHDRVFTLGVGQRDPSWRGIYLNSGSGAVLSDDNDLPFSATCLIWVPWSSDKSLRIGAGSTGYHFALTDASLANAIGLGAESSELRLLMGRRIVIRLDRDDPVTADIEYAFSTIVKEADTQSKGSTTMIEAQVRAILVQLWRNSEQGPESASAAGRTPQVLQHFRQLLEAHFRDHWPISRYAAAVGVTPDRLHDICSRHIGRAPSVLVQERLIHESRMMLENTAMSADLISATIGFRDASHFSRFFKARVGLPPVAYRTSCLKARQTDTPTPQHSYSDWP